MSGSPGAAREALPCCEEHRGAECVPWPTGETEEQELFVEGDVLYDAMLSSIGAATGRVDLETYIYAADEVTGPGWSRRPWTRLLSESAGWIARRWL
ncbi:MAG: hypothetical protein HOP28_17740 [Gemmatimonadales bacterium]|nr:hypothetical protein [Gemmatimonadales bacterium]